MNRFLSMEYFPVSSAIKKGVVDVDFAVIIKEILVIGGKKIEAKTQHKICVDFNLKHVVESTENS